MAGKVRINEGKKTLFDFFINLDDPRIERNLRHNFMDIIVMAICAVIANANDWNEIETWGYCKQEWLETFLELPNGIPSHDTFNRVFSALDPQKFVECFAAWVNSISLTVEGTVIAIDGKKLRRSSDDCFGKTALHLVSAWSTDLHITLGQIKTAEKSNEITAIPELLDMLMIKGAIITIDAMGCQKEIAAKIKDKNAEYVLALKGNHGDLYDDIKTFFDFEEKTNFKGKISRFETLEKDHGRIEKRIFLATNKIDWLNEKCAWKGLQSIAMVISERREKGKKSIERRYYLTSLKPNAEKIGHAIRSHWGIENTLHWQLDVNFKEDQSRLRAKNSAENFAAIRRIALSLLKQDTSRKMSMKCKRLLAGWDNNYLLKIIGVKAF